MDYLILASLGLQYLINWGLAGVIFEILAGEIINYQISLK